ncbi:MAG TPA: hypothetical protein VFU04_08560 [Solirubrobacterales bacterium]|nr:hypothetical protein [Solirubrobacterales bacterium]
MLNRIIIFGWPLVAVCVLVPVLKSLDPPPSVIVLALTALGALAAVIQVVFLDIPESWLRTEDEEHDARGQEQDRHDAPQD